MKFPEGELSTSPDNTQYESLKSKAKSAADAVPALKYVGDLIMEFLPYFSSFI